MKHLFGATAPKMNHSFVIATIPVLLDVETRPLGTPVLVRIPDSGLDPLGRYVSGRSKVIRSFHDCSVGPFPTDRYTDDHPDADEDQCRGTFDTFGELVLESGSLLHLDFIDMTKVPELVRCWVEQKTKSTHARDKSEKSMYERKTMLIYGIFFNEKCLCFSLFASNWRLVRNDQVKLMH